MCCRQGREGREGKVEGLEGLLLLVKSLGGITILQEKENSGREGDAREMHKKTHKGIEGTAT